MQQLTLPPAWDFHSDLCILVGEGSGDLAHELKNQGQRRLFIVAPEEETDLPEGVAHVSSPGELFYPIVSVQGAAPAQVVVHPTAKGQATLDLRDAVVKTTRKAVRSRQSQHLTIDRNGATWLRQGLENLPALARFPDVSRLFGRFNGCTAFVCAPGPSLSEAIAHLKAKRGAGLIIAVSHAAQSLIDAGVNPDIVIAADPGNLERHFRRVDSGSIQALVVAATCRRALFDVPACTHFHFAGNGRADDWLYAPLGVDARLASGGSVSCSAASLAIKLGCTRVVFAGLDLSFPGGRYYAAEGLDGDARVKVDGDRFFLRKEAGSEGSSYVLPDGGLRFSADQKLVSIPAVCGGEVATSQALMLYLNWFESMVPVVGSQVQFVQTSRTGALIAGFQHNSIADEVASAIAPEVDFATIAREVAQAHSFSSTRDRLRTHFEKVLEVLPMVLELTRGLSSLSVRAASNPELVGQLQAGEQELRKALRPLALLSVAAHGDLQRAEAEARKGTTWEENLRATRRIFLAIERVTRVAQPALEQALAEL